VSRIKNNKDKNYLIFLYVSRPITFVFFNVLVQATVGNVRHVWLQADPPKNSKTEEKKRFRISLKMEGVVLPRRPPQLDFFFLWQQHTVNKIQEKKYKKSFN
jgi:hypothetical protein